MRRLLAAGLLAAAALAPAAPASAGPSGQCDGKVDVVCREDQCQPDYPCTPVICLVWLNNRCGL